MEDRVYRHIPSIPVIARCVRSTQRCIDVSLACHGLLFLRCQLYRHLVLRALPVKLGHCDRQLASQVLESVGAKLDKGRLQAGVILLFHRLDSADERRRERLGALAVLDNLGRLDAKLRGTYNDLDVCQSNYMGLGPSSVCQSGDRAASEGVFHTSVLSCTLPSS